MHHELEAARGLLLVDLGLRGRRRRDLDTCGSSLLGDELGGVVVVGPAVDRHEGHRDALAVLGVDAVAALGVAGVGEDLLSGSGVGRLRALLGHPLGEPLLVTGHEGEGRRDDAGLLRERLRVDLRAVEHEVDRLADGDVRLRARAPELGVRAGVDDRGVLRGVDHGDATVGGDGLGVRDEHRGPVDLAGGEQALRRVVVVDAEVAELLDSRLPLLPVLRVLLQGEGLRRGRVDHVGAGADSLFVGPGARLFDGLVLPDVLRDDSGHEQSGDGGVLRGLELRDDRRVVGRLGRDQAERLGRLVVPGEGDVLRREGGAVVPRDTLAGLHGDLGAVLVELVAHAEHRDRVARGSTVEVEEGLVDRSERPVLDARGVRVEVRHERGLRPGPDVEDRLLAAAPAGAAVRVAAAPRGDQGDTRGQRDCREQSPEALSSDHR